MNISKTKFLLDSLGIIRLEKHFKERNYIYGYSSFPNWISAISKFVKRLGIIMPIDYKKEISIKDKEDSIITYVIREQDMIFNLPNMSGYMNIILKMPFLIMQIIRLRCFCKHIICRIPEHGNIIILPLLYILRFNIFIWIVGNRRELEKVQLLERKINLKKLIGITISKLTGMVEEIFIKKCPAIVNGTKLEEAVVKIKKEKSKIIKIYSSGLSKKNYPAELNKNIDIKNKIELLYVGRVKKEKGVFDLVRATYILKNRGLSNINLNLVGPISDDYCEIKKLIIKNNLEQHVRLFGPILYGDKLFHFYRKCHILVLTSKSEGTPRVIIEAMAFGLPVVATDIGSINDVVTDYENGILLKRGTEIEISDAIEKILINRQLYGIISRNNYIKAKKYLLENIVLNIISFIERNIR